MEGGKVAKVQSPTDTSQTSPWMTRRADKATAGFSVDGSSPARRPRHATPADGPALSTPAQRVAMRLQ